MSKKSTDSPLSSAKAILELSDRKPPQKIYVKAWGREVFIRDPSGRDRDEWEIFASNNRGQYALWRAKVAQILLCDENEKRLFSEADLDKLADKSAAALHEIWEIGTAALSVTDVEIDELQKNSDASL